MYMYMESPAECAVSLPRKIVVHNCRKSACASSCVSGLIYMAEKAPPSSASEAELFRVVREEIPLSRRESEEIIARRLGEGPSSSSSFATPTPQPPRVYMYNSPSWSQRLCATL